MAEQSKSEGGARGPLELRHFRYFLALAKSLSFVKAAAEIGIAQPALSQQIIALEKAVGAKLFERNSRSVTLSTAGRVFLREAERTVLQVDRAQDVAERAGRGELGAISIAYAGSTLYSGILSSLVYGFHKTHPDVSVSIVEMGIEDQLEAIDTGSIDIGIVRTPLGEKPPSVSTRTLLSEPIMLALRADHHLASQEVINIDQLSREAVISSQTDDVGILKIFLSAANDRGYYPRMIRARHFGAIMSLVSAGLGVAPVPKSADALRLAGIVYRPIEGLRESEVAIAYRAATDEPVVQAFLNF